MVQEDHQGGVQGSAPQWPPIDGRNKLGGSHDFMAKCARAGGREVEWPPRCDEVYGSNPGLNTTSGSNPGGQNSSGSQVHAPPVPPRPRYYPLNKAHVSAPNLFEDQDQSKFRSKPSIPVRATAASDVKSAAPEETLGNSSESTSKVPQENNFEMESSSSSQVRFTTTNQSFQNEPMILGGSTQFTSQQYSMTGNPNMLQRDIPIDHDGSKQQGVLQQKMMMQQQKMLQNFQQHQQQHFQQPADHFPQQFDSDVQIPVQMSSANAPIQSSVTLPKTVNHQNVVNPNNASQAYGPTPPHGMQQVPLNVTPGFQPQYRVGSSQFQGVEPVTGDATEWPPQPPQSADDTNLTTVYPSSFKLRSEMPVEQEGVKVFPSQPAFKMTKPIKMRGDSKWPPSGAAEDTPQQEVRQFIKPKKQTKDYSGFFAQHSLPSNYTGYRAPPGTQHVGCDGEEEEEEDATDM